MANPQLTRLLAVSRGLDERRFVIMALAEGSRRGESVAEPNVQYHMVPCDAGHLKRIDQGGHLSRRAAWISTTP